MREVQITQYEAWDGQRFDSAAKARDYEGRNLHARLAGIPAERIQAAIDGTDADLADAYERLGKIIAEARKRRGETKWPAARVAAQPKPEPEPVQENAA
jgi:hypothetical protein